MKKSLRFCMITTFYPPYNFGGDGIFVRNLSNELARHGHHVSVIHCLDAYLSAAKKEPEQAYEDHPNVTVYGLKSAFGIISPLTTHQTGAPYFKSAKIKKILSADFDVIHYHNISLVGGPKVLSYGRCIKLYTMHEYWLVCPTHMLFKFQREPCTARECLRCTLSHGRPPQWWRYTGLLQQASRHVDAFIAPSRFSKELHDRELDLPTVHLPYFVPHSELQATDDRPAPQDLPYFLFVGRLSALKGVQTLIPVFRSYPKAQLWIAGSGDYEKHLKQMAQDCDNIRFLGFQSGQQLESLYRGAIGLIVPTLYYEIFGLVIVEALRQHTPVIVRNIGGMPELVRESGGGLIYDSEETLRAAMDKLAMDLSYRDELGERGHRHYIKQWTPEVYLDKYFHLVDQIASGKLSPPASRP